MTNKGLISSIYNRSYTSTLKKKQNKTEQTFFQRGNADGQQAHVKMFSITNHQGNENQSHNEITPVILFNHAF